MITFYSEDTAIPRACPQENEDCKAEAVHPDCAKVAVLIDRCVLADVKRLWALGIKTVCSCCGHGNQAAAFIAVEPEESGRMKELGYEEAPLRYAHCKDCGEFYKPKHFGMEV